MIELLFLITVILILVIINGFFVAAEFAIAAVPATRMAQLAEQGLAKAQQVLNVLREPQRMSNYLSTVQAGITLASLGLGMYGEHALATVLLGPLEHIGWVGEALAHTIATIAAVALLTFLHVVLGEMVPKSLALHDPEAAALRLLSIMQLVERVLKPLTVILTWLGDHVLLWLHVAPMDTNAGLSTASELEYIVEESSEQGLILPMEQVYLENVIDFSERTVNQVMTRRTRIVALEVEATLPDVLRVIAESRFSRYPIYEGSRDNVIGVLHIKDLARELVRNKDSLSLRSLLRQIAEVPVGASLEKTLDLFRKQHVQIAIVIDEFGGTAGLVTLEDLAEELIGEILDEFDFEEMPPISVLEENKLLVRGDLLLDELEQHYDLVFTSDEADTVAGLILHELGRTAQPGDVVDVQGVRFEVATIERLAIATVIVTLPTGNPPPNNSADKAVDDGLEVTI
ncbi:MAG: hemolysin family protein [Caldilineaceae bacterium]